MKRAAAIGVAALLAACGGGNSHLSGSIDGHSVDAANAIYLVGKPPSTAAGDVLIVVTTLADACAAMQAKEFFKDAQVLSLSLANDIPAIGLEYPPTPGTFSFDPNAAPGRFATGLFVENKGCSLAVNAPVTSGSVTLDKVGIDSSVKATGSLELNFASETVTGTFTAPFCDADPAAISAPCQ